MNRSRSAPRRPIGNAECRSRAGGRARDGDAQTIVNGIRRRRATRPKSPRPTSMSAHVEGSGTLRFNAANRPSFLLLRVELKNKGMTRPPVFAVGHAVSLRSTQTQPFGAPGVRPVRLGPAVNTGRGGIIRSRRIHRTGEDTPFARRGTPARPAFSPPTEGLHIAPRQPPQRGAKCEEGRIR